MNQKGFSPILIILIVLVVLAGAIYLNKVNTKLLPQPIPISSQQTQDETAILKTYTNTKFAFSLKYPSTYKVSNGVVELKTDTDDSALLLLTDTKNSNNFFVAVVMKKQYADPHAYNGSEYNPFTSNIDKFLVSKIGDKISITNGSSYNKLSDTKIGDKTALVFENRESKNEGYLVIDTQKYIYILGRYNGELKSFQEIFSTFEFLDQNQTADISNWRTYNSLQGGYIIQYPQSWIGGETFFASVGDMKRSTSPFVMKPSDSNPQYSVSVDVINNDSSLSIQDFVNKYIVSTQGINFNPTTIGGISGMRISSLGGQAINENVFVIHNSKIYQIRLNYNNTGVKDEVMRNFDQILSTFKFIQ